MTEEQSEAPATQDPSRAGLPVEELRGEEVSSSLEELQAALQARRSVLEGTPDGPRPAAPRGSYKRRQFLVDLPLQLSYVGVYLATFTLLAVGFIALNFMFKAVYERALMIQQHADRFHDSPEVLLLGLVNFAFVLLLVIGMAVYAIIQSHRIAGPAYRFRRALDQIKSRDYDWHLKLRQRDFLQDLAEQLNTVNEALKARDLVVTASAGRLTELVTRCSDPELAARLQEVAVELGEVVLPLEPEPDAEAEVEPVSA